MGAKSEREREQKMKTESNYSLGSVMWEIALCDDTLKSAFILSKRSFHVDRAVWCPA